ncbi:hypothetical protein ACQ4PT_028078 [Festuca glaucescens]
MEGGRRLHSQQGDAPGTYPEHVTIPSFRSPHHPVGGPGGSWIPAHQASLRRMAKLLPGGSPTFNRGEWFSRVEEHTNLLGSGPLANPDALFSPSRGARRTSSASGGSGGYATRAHGCARCALERQRRRREHAVRVVATAGHKIRVKGRRAYNIICPFLHQSMRYVTWPRGFNPGLLPRYDGLTDPLDFLQRYTAAVLAAQGDHCVLAHGFPGGLNGPTRQWLESLPEMSVSSWGNLCECFIARFAVNHEHPPSKNDLRAMAQRPRESLRDYNRRFRQVLDRIPNIFSKDITDAFFAGTSHLGVRKTLARRKFTSAGRLFRIVSEHVQAETGRTANLR